MAHHLNLRATLLTLVLLAFLLALLLSLSAHIGALLAEGAAADPDGSPAETAGGGVMDPNGTSSARLFDALAIRGDLDPDG